MVAQEECGARLPPGTRQKHLPVEQFPLKTNWSLAERLVYCLGCKKDPHRIK